MKVDNKGICDSDNLKVVLDVLKAHLPGKDMKEFNSDRNLAVAIGIIEQLAKQLADEQVELFECMDAHNKLLEKYIERGAQLEVFNE